MKATAEQPLNPPELHTFLVEGGLLKAGDNVVLAEYNPAFPRQSHSHRWHYRVEHARKNLCHLIVGMRLSDMHERAKGLAGACPELTCRPLLFRERKDGMGFLCLEHFEGESLDHLVEKGRCDSVTWLAQVRRAQALLARTEQTSTPKKLAEEVNSLIEAACGYPGLADFDVQFLRGPAQQAILAGALSVPLLVRWSNGDFAGRNLLIDSQGNLRLIDYEFAGPTHFGSGDWLRLREFSVIPPGLEENSIPEIKSARRPWLEVQFWIHHLAQLKTAEPSRTVTQHSTEAVGRLMRAIGETLSDDCPAKNDSLIIKLLSQHQLEKNLLIEERTAWAKSLEAELDSTRKNFEKISAEYAGRSTWASSLETELRTVQSHFEKLNQAFEERTTWALAMESELQTLRASHQGHLSELRNASMPLAHLLRIPSDSSGAAVLEESLAALANLKRDLAVNRAETDRVAAALLDTTLNLNTATGEMARLTAALNDAQIHLNGLLGHAANQQLQINLLEGAKREAESKLAQNEQLLHLLKTKLQAAKIEVLPPS